MNWFENFKIALIEEDERKLASLISQIPPFDTQDEMVSAMHLIDQARKLYENKKSLLAKEMNEIRLSKKFLASADDTASQRQLDITS